MWTLLTIVTFLLVATAVKCFMQWYVAKRNAADMQYQKARELLRKWQVARPFLKVGACTYSRALVYEMIDAYSKLLCLWATFDQEHLQYLRGLLDQDPRPYNPITFDSAQSGVISFSY